MSDMRREGKDPVIPLSKKPYGEPDAGDECDLLLNDAIERQGWQKLATSVVGSMHPTGDTFCRIDVDDGAAVGALVRAPEFIW